MQMASINLYEPIDLTIFVPRMKKLMASLSIASLFSTTSIRIIALVVIPMMSSVDDGAIFPATMTYVTP